MKYKYGKVIYIFLYIIGLGGCFASFIIDIPQQTFGTFLLIFLAGRWLSHFVNKKEW